jgi:hypothetical protein
MTRLLATAGGFGPHGLLVRQTRAAVPPHAERTYLLIAALMALALPFAIWFYDDRRAAVGGSSFSLRRRW